MEGKLRRKNQTRVHDTITEGADGADLELGNGVLTGTYEAQYKGTLQRHCALPGKAVFPTGAGLTIPKQLSTHMGVEQAGTWVVRGSYRGPHWRRGRLQVSRVGLVLLDPSLKHQRGLVCG